MIVSTKSIKNTGLLSALFIFLMFIAGCSDNSNNPSQTPSALSVTRLVSDIGGSGASQADPHLINPWGLTFDQDGNIAVASNSKGLFILYDKNGVKIGDDITIPSANNSGPGLPTGMIFNTTADFNIQVTGEKAQFIFVTEDGLIAAWSSGKDARIVSDRSTFGAVYKGLTIANDGGQNFIYATNFKARTIDVFDKNFSLVSGKSFTDPSIPSDYGPFGINNINGQIYVTYARLGGNDNNEDEPGAGNGYVDVFSTNGSLVRRFASQGKLNSPSGVAKAPSNFGGYSNQILVANSGDGLINVYDNDGKFLYAMADSAGSAITIPGLKSIAFSNVEGNTLYYTAGSKLDNHGQVGIVKLR